MELGDRKILILKSVIRSYMETGEPVGSRTLSKLPDLGVSPATIRNEMSDLEEMGYLIQPHTSAGRIPSDKSYRFYVDQIMKEKETEVAEFKDLVIQRVDKLEYVLRQLAKMLAANTNYATMISGPSIQRNKIKFLQLSRMDARKLLLATVFEGNICKNRIISSEEDLSEADVSELNMLLNTTLTGLPMSEISLDRIMKLKNAAGSRAELMDRILTEIAEAFRNEEENLEVYTSGATNIFRYPELKESDSVERFIDTFERKDELREMLNEINSRESREGIQVYIGDELPITDMNEYSMMTANYEFGEGVRGTIGIVGPKRMDYDKVLGTLRNVLKQLDSQFKIER